MEPHPETIPNAEHAIVRIEKITGYVLNPDSQTGRHKALVIEAALGFTQSDAAEFAA